MTPPGSEAGKGRRRHSAERIPVRGRNPRRQKHPEEQNPDKKADQGGPRECPNQQRPPALAGKPRPGNQNYHQEMNAVDHSRHYPDKGQSVQRRLLPEPRPQGNHQGNKSPCRRRAAASNAGQLPPSHRSVAQPGHHHPQQSPGRAGIQRPRRRGPEPGCRRGSAPPPGRPHRPGSPLSSHTAAIGGYDGRRPAPLPGSGMEISGTPPPAAPGPSPPTAGLRPNLPARQT